MNHKKKKDKLECITCQKKFSEWHKTSKLCPDCYFQKEGIDFGNNEISIKFDKSMKNTFLAYLRKKMSDEFILTFKRINYCC